MAGGVGAAGTNTDDPMTIGFTEPSPVSAGRLASEGRCADLPRGKRRRWRRTGGWSRWVLPLLLALAGAARSEAADTAPAVAAGADSLPIARSFAQFWELGQKGATECRIQARMHVLCYFPQWRVLWVWWDNMVHYLDGGPAAQALVAGEWYDIDGFGIAGPQTIHWSRTTITRVPGLPGPDYPRVQAGFSNVLGATASTVEIEGLIDDQTEVDPAHLKLTVVVENQALAVYLPLGPTEPVLQLTGVYMRARGVLSVKRSTAEARPELEFWIPGSKALTQLRQLADSPEFDRPVTLIEALRSKGSMERVLVSGKVHRQDAGRSVTVRDSTGQLKVLTPQVARFREGEEVEAIGFPEVDSVNLALRDGVVRRAGARRVEDTSVLEFRLADQVRNIAPDDLERGPQARINGVITWIAPDDDYFFMEDASGGLRVRGWKALADRPLLTATGLTIKGIVQAGEYVPHLQATEVLGGDNLSLPDPPRITWEQAMTGAFHGRWVELEGIVRGVSATPTQSTMELTALSGEYRATVSGWVAPELVGSYVHLRGVCEVITNAQQQLIGIRLLIPAADHIRVAEPAPADPFAIPRESIGSLRRFSSNATLYRRVQVAATVLHHLRGQAVFVQDGADVLTVLSRQPEPLRSGDRISIVGIPGQQAGRLIMREAVYRRDSGGSPPAPVEIDSHRVVAEREGQLVRLEGTLIDAVRTPERFRLQLQAGGMLFNAALAADDGMPAVEYQVGSQLALTGVYRLERDEYREARGFQVQLRSPADIVILAQPPWWTSARVLWIAAVLLTIAILTGGWGWSVARKNSQLKLAQLKLERANAELENRVEQRTKALRQEIEQRRASEASREALHRELLETSRRAGMAEVATGVLHNVGNVLNSVNISATLASDLVVRSKCEKLGLVVDLLARHRDALPAFFASDPRAQKVPEYLSALHQQLRAEQEEVVKELSALSRNVDHIKQIVSMQQSYAKVAGVLEKVPLQEVVEDALRMNSESLARHGLVLAKEFEANPVIEVERHKVLQILINLISNAKNACEDRGGTDGRITIRIREEGGRALVQVIDNGVGIPAENLTRIFSHGFTTRKTGHGFGLHSGAIAARDLGGLLQVHSEGEGRGATFTLELPILKAIPAAAAVVTT